MKLSHAHLEGVEVVGADGDEGALTAQVLVELVLEVDEAVIRGLVQRHAAQDGGDDERPHERRLRLDRHALAAGHDGVGGRGAAAEEDVQSTRDALEAQHVVPVRRDVDLVDDVLTRARGTGRRAALLPEQLRFARLHARGAYMWTGMPRGTQHDVPLRVVAVRVPTGGQWSSKIMWGMREHLV